MSGNNKEIYQFEERYATRLTEEEHRVIHIDKATGHLGESMHHLDILVRHSKDHELLEKFVRVRSAAANIQAILTTAQVKIHEEAKE